MALRNKKWSVRQACVSTLEADGTICNEAGTSPAGLQMQTSGKRFGTAMLFFAMVHLKTFDIDLGNLGYLAACGFLAAALVDHLLAWRWWGLAHMHKHAKGSGLTKAGRTKGKVRQKGKAS